MNVVEIEHLCYTYPGADKPTLQDVDLTIEKGDFLAIVGNNGCGKSTLCKTLNGLIPQFITGEFSGRVRVCGLDAAGTDVGALARKVGYVYQDFENQIIRPTVLDDASYACLNYALPDYLDRGRQALAQCGLQGREADFIWQLSGGQTHLLALAGVLSLQPEVLILDEPIAQLDPGAAPPGEGGGGGPDAAGGATHRGLGCGRPSRRCLSWPRPSPRWTRRPPTGSTACCGP